MWEMRGSRLGEVGPEKEVGSLLTRTHGRAIRFGEGRNILDLLAVENMHENAKKVAAARGGAEDVVGNKREGNTTSRKRHRSRATYV